MGSLASSNRRMSDYDTDSDILDFLNDDSDQGITTVLQYLIRSGEVRIMQAASEQSFQDDSDDDFFATPGPPKGIYVETHPDTSQIEGSDISYNIKLNSGALNYKTDSSKQRPVCSLLNMRETGMRHRQQFSTSDKCQIYRRFLPNKMKPIDSYSCKVFCGTFARDGDIFMSASQDFYIRVYDSQSSQFKILKMVEARDVGWSILDTAVSPDGRHFIYCSWSECIHICNVFGDNETHIALPLFPAERRFCIFAMCFSHDGKEILGGANDECLYVYNREANERTLKIHAHEDDVNTVAFADSTSQILFSGGDDGLCKVWDRRTLCESDPKPVGILVGHEDGITYVDSKGDGRHLITNSKDQTIKLWDMRKFSPNCSLEGSRKAVQSHNWDYRWQRVPVSLNKPKKKLSGDTSLMTYRGHSVLQTLIRCHFSPEATTGQQYIYTGCAQGRVVIYDVLTGKIKTILTGHKSCVRDVAWHPYRNEIISSSWDGIVGKWTYSGKLEIDSFEDECDCNSCNQPDSFEDECKFKPRRSQRLADQRKRNAASEKR